MFQATVVEAKTVHTCRPLVGEGRARGALDYCSKGQQPSQHHAPPGTVAKAEAESLRHRHRHTAMKEARAQGSEQGSMRRPGQIKSVSVFKKQKRKKRVSNQGRAGCRGG